VTKAYFEDGGQAESVTLVILLERPVEPRIYSLAAPPRLVVDLHNAHAHMMLPNEISPRTDSLIKGVRIGEHENEGFVRFVCDLWDDEQYSVTPRLRILEGGSPGAELRVTVARTESQSR
jgi:hypothetical protein